VIVPLLANAPTGGSNPDREEDVDLQGVPLSPLSFFSNPVYPTPVPSLDNPLSHKGIHREGLIARE